MGTINSIVKKSPNFIKQAYYNFVPFELRYGDTFKNTYKEIIEHLNWDYNKLKEYQFNELKKILVHCDNNVAYYNKIFKEYSFNPHKLQDFNDINILPFLTKDIIRENYNDLLAKNYKDKKLYTLKTSGSTGKKLQFLATDDTYKKEAAFILRTYKEHGATLYDKPSIWLRRYVPDNKEKPLWTYDHELKRLYMSAYHLNATNLKDYLKEISKRKYHTLVGYPSSIYALACLLEEVGGFINISAIHTASEMMLPQWKEKIEHVLGIKVKSHYGQMEKVSLYHQDSYDDLYKENLDYSYNEIINENEENIVVGTGFINYAMPFIRYKTNDTAEINKNLLTHKGLPKSVLLFNGRSDDILISKSGVRIPGVNFYTMMYNIDGIKMFQIIQKDRDIINLKLVKNSEFTDETMTKIKKGIRERVGDVNITTDFVQEIQRNTINGKIRCVFNEIQ